MCLVVVGDLSVSTRDLINFVNHRRDNFYKVVPNNWKLIGEVDLVSRNLESQSQESLLKIRVRVILTLNDLLRCRILPVCLLEALKELNVVVNRLGCELSHLV